MNRSVNDRADGQHRSGSDKRMYEFIDDPIEPGAPPAGTGDAPVDKPSSDSAASPTPQFRNHLHRALEETHRQQAARRVLGAHYSDYQQRLDEQRRQHKLLALLAALVALFIFTLIQRRKACRQ